MKKNRILLSSVCAIVLLSSSAFAEVKELDTVEIWSTEEKSLQADDIEINQADHLSDLLRSVAGVNVSGSHSLNNKIVIRGVKDEELYITIDGAKQPNVNMFNHQGNLIINPDILKKVKIQVGNNSVVYGDVGGAVEFETKDGRDFLKKGQSVGGMISTTYNSNKSISGSLSTFGKVGKDSDFLIYYNYTDSKNWKMGNGTKKEGLDGETDDLLIKYGLNFDDKNRITLSYDTMTNEGKYLKQPNFSIAMNQLLAGGQDYLTDTEYTRDTYTLKHEYNLGAALYLNTSFYYNELGFTRKNGTINSKIKNVGINSKAQSNLEIGSILNTFTYGLLYDEQKSEEDKNIYYDDEEAQTLALYIEDAVDFDNGFVLTPGIRFTNYQLNGIAGDFDENEVTYSLAAQYALTDTLSLFGSYTTFFRGLPMIEVSSIAKGPVTVNSDVDSETGDNSEIGFKYIESGILGADDISFSAKYFITNTENDLDYYSLSNTLLNLGDTEVKGVEANFSYYLDNFNALLTYTHMDSEIKDIQKSLYNETGDTFSLNLKYKVNSEVEFSWKSILVLDKKDTNSELLDTGIKKDGYNVHDIAVKYTPKSFKDVKIIAGIDNIFDKYYASHASDYYGSTFMRGTLTDLTDYEAGRNFKLTLSYKF